MVDQASGLHPDADRLLEHAEGTLARDVADGIAAHLAACAACRLELAQLRRFGQLDRDAELIEEADWPRAEAALERAFHARIAPAAVRPRPAPGRLLRLPPRPARRLILTAAAAALLALALFGWPAWRGGEGAGPGAGPVRGPVAGTGAIVTVAPVGALPAPPERFSWRAEGDFDAFDLDVITVRLDVVFSRTGLRDTTFVVPDSLRALLQPGRTYLWSVRGLRGLGVVAASGQAWFTVAHPPRSR